MDNKKNIIYILAGLLIVLIIFLGVTLINLKNNPQEDDRPDVVTELPDINDEDETPEIQEVKEYIPIVFIGKNSNGEEVYKVVKREYDEDVDGAKLRYAVSSLILGPKQSEKQLGIYSEVPSGANILHVYDKGDHIILDLSSGFAYGGGTESLYKRLFQLIKTVKRNTDKPTYLYIDGKQADVIGGDGIMITQPLSENSIGE